MAAPAGNEFWKACKRPNRPGPKRQFKTDRQLWNACVKYFQWVEDNPFLENKTAQYQGQPVDISVYKMRAMTIGGLCLFIGIKQFTWRRWRKDEELCAIVTHVDEIIREYKFTGAAADLLNSNIIARELGLVDKKESKVALSLEDLSDEELDRKLQQLLLEHNG